MNRQQRRKGMFLMGDKKQEPTTRAENKANRKIPIEPLEVKVREKRDENGRMFRTTRTISRNGKVFTETTWR